MFDMGTTWKDGFEMFCDVRDLAEASIEFLQQLQLNPERWNLGRLWCVADSQTYKVKS